MKRLIVALCALVSVAACSDDSSSADPPSPSPTVASSTAEPSPTQEPETPEEFVRRWVAADTRMQNTGEGSEYRAMSPKCPNCLDYADYIEGIWSAGGYVETRGWLVKSASTSKPLPSGAVDVTIDVTSTAAEFVEEAGGPVKHYKTQQLTYIVSLQPFHRGWSTTRFAQVAQ